MQYTPSKFPIAYAQGRKSRGRTRVHVSHRMWTEGRQWDPSPQILTKSMFIFLASLRFVDFNIYVHIMLIVFNVSIFLLFIYSSLGTNGPTGADVP